MLIQEKSPEWRGALATGRIIPAALEARRTTVESFPPCPRRRPLQPRRLPLRALLFRRRDFGGCRLGCGGWSFSNRVAETNHHHAHPDARPARGENPTLNWYVWFSAQNCKDLGTEKLQKLGQTVQFLDTSFRADCVTGYVPSKLWKEFCAQAPVRDDHGHDLWHESAHICAAIYLYFGNLLYVTATYIFMVYVWIA